MCWQVQPGAAIGWQGQQNDEYVVQPVEWMECVAVQVNVAQ
jgi:hypothetical protein